MNMISFLSARSSRLAVISILTLLLSSCTTAAPNVPLTPTSIPTPADPGVLAATEASVLRQRIPALAQRDERLAAALDLPVPVLEYTGTLDDAQKAAQAIALQNADFLRYVRDPITNVPFRSEIFGVYPAKPSDLTDASAACRSSSCYRVEMYNYALNLASVAIVDLPAKAVRSISEVQDTAPDIPPYLIDLATQIAINSAAVTERWGGTPPTDAASMANAKTALNATRCERSKHLCVAPTFLRDKQALWAIVDLTDGMLVGAQWTELGEFNGPRVTEKKIQDQVISRDYCDQENVIERDGWKMGYMLTSSDGLMVVDAAFQGQAVLKSAKLVDWHVSYSKTQGFGYSDAIGCPIFSQAAIIAIGPPVIADLLQDQQIVGFSMTQQYWSEYWPQPCNYNYAQVYEFYNDGRFRIKGASLGRGCGNDGMYRPVFRIVPAGLQTFAQWDGSAWKDWENEQWIQEGDLATDPQGQQFRLTAQNGPAYYMLPAQGQFNDGGRGDKAYVYVTRRVNERDEGDSNLVTIGPCCNENYQQGPEKFIDAQPEPIREQEIVIWYVAQLKNDDTPGSEYCWADQKLLGGLYETEIYPCYGGPMFVPVVNNQ